MKKLVIQSRQFECWWIRDNYFVRRWGFEIFRNTGSEIVRHLV